MEAWEVLLLSAGILFVLLGVGVAVWMLRQKSEDVAMKPLQPSAPVDTSEMKLPNTQGGTSEHHTMNKVWEAFHKAKDDEMTVILTYNTMRAWADDREPQEAHWRVGVPAHEAHLLQELVSPNGYQLKMHPRWEDHERNEDETDALFTDGQSTLYINLVYMGPGVYPRATPPTPLYEHDNNAEVAEAFTGLLKGGMMLHGKLSKVRFMGHNVYTYPRHMVDVFNRDEGWTNPVKDGFW